MFLLIDNYDSFTYNLVQYFQRLGHEPTVLTNDDPRVLDLAQSPELKMVCLSPGPGHPAKAGLCLEVLAKLPAHIPVLGVCLGHQVLGLFGGAEIKIAQTIMHGKASDINHDSTGIFSGLTSPLTVGRYHSLVVEPKEGQELPFTVTAHGPQGEVMALQYKDRPWVGLQFHPESVLTPSGLRLLGNFPQAAFAQSDADTQIRTILETLAQGQDLSPAAATMAFTALLDGHMSPVQAGAFLMGLKMKGESATELVQAARTALSRAVPINYRSQTSIDIVGTGGDGQASFNCSTATALTLAGMGYKVLKHGNRAVSSPCGSADAIEALGIPLDLTQEKVVANLEEKNFAFLFAPQYHPAFGQVAPLRRSLGMRTLFNLLGPLINPAMPSHLLLGVARAELLPLLAGALKAAPLKKAAVVHGGGDYDEITPMGISQILLVERQVVSPMSLNPKDYGIEPCSPEDLAVNDKNKAMEVLQLLLSGQGPKAMQDMLVLNVAMGIYLLGESTPMATAIAQAREAVVSGAGKGFINAVKQDKINA